MKPAARSSISSWGRWLCLVGLGWSVALPSWAQQQAEDPASFVVEDVRIEGLNRVSIGNFFVALPIAMQERIDSERLRSAARQLFETGQFDDIQFHRESNILLITVVERPSILSLDVNGNKALPEESLLTGLADVGLSPGNIFKRSTIETVRRELLRQYVSQGFYGARVEILADLKEQNRVAINVEIVEGKVSRIQRINIVGNRHIPDSELLGALELRGQGGFFAFIGGQSRRYSREQLRADVDSIRDYYLDRGYLRIDVKSVDVSISPDSSGVFITVVLDENSVFDVGEIEVVGELPVEEELVRANLLFLKGQRYVQSLISASEERVTQLLNQRGYANAQVRVVPDFPEGDDKVANMRLYIDPGERTYVRRINFSGNRETRDDILRLSMLQLEGNVASSGDIEFSRLRLQRTGFFRDVRIDQKEVPGSLGEIDLDVVVEEQLSGSISFSLGYNDASGTFGQFAVSRDNILGSGKNLSINLSSGSTTEQFNASVIDPFFTDNGISLGWNFNIQEVDFNQSSIAGYVSDTAAVNVSFGVPLNNASRFTLSLGAEQTSITTGSSRFWLIEDFINDELNNGAFTSFNLSFGWSSNTLNRGIFPTSGTGQSATLEFGLSDQVGYARLDYNVDHFIPIGHSSAFIIRNRIGYLNTLGNTELPPFFKLFYTGGNQTVRGYEYLTLGPWIYGGDSCQQVNTASEQVSSGQNYENCSDTGGGTFLVQGSLEWVIPFPGLEDVDTVRPVFFFDYGNVFAQDCDPRYYWAERCEDVEDFFTGNARLRWSAGVAVTWLTSFGPLYFIYSITPDTETYDETNDFEFTLGSVF